MAITLIVNPGSTSRKYALYRDGACFASLHIERAPDGAAACLTTIGGSETCEPWVSDSLEGALGPALQQFVTAGVLPAAAAITRVGIRVVAPGARFQAHARIDATYITELESLAYLVPIHIPLVLAEYRDLSDALPGVPVIGVSDSAFHAGHEAFRVQISLGDQAIRRYGYHGLSIASIARKLHSLPDGMPTRTVVLHVGGGVSVCALYEGKSIATSMGFTPASGIIMGTRGGDVGADALAAYMKAHDLGPVDALQHLYTESGFKAVCGVADLRLVLERAAQGDVSAVEARAAFLEQLAVTVAAQVVRLGGVDAVVLTATALVRNPELRALLLAKLSVFGVKVDDERNEVLVGKEGMIAASDSVPVYVMKTDEMGEMIRAVDAYII